MPIPSGTTPSKRSSLLVSAVASAFALGACVSSTSEGIPRDMTLSDAAAPAVDGGPAGSDDASSDSSSATPEGAPVEAAAADGGAGSPPGQGPTGLHAVGNQVEDSSGTPIVLHGVNRSGPEYMCVQNNQIFDGPATDASVAVIASWKNVNAVRVPLNESCWLGINGVRAATSGNNYVTAIVDYVALLHKYGLVPILDLHWVGPGTTLATRQQPMADADHAPAFWTAVTGAFANDTGVVFDLYNEPFPDSNRDSAAGWQCWQNGCTATQAVAADAGPPPTYAATGFSQLVAAVRAAEAGGPSHLLLLGGLQYSNTLTQWLAYAPTDSNIAASWHVYSTNGCRTAACYNGSPAGVAAKVPLVATEIGENDCMGAFITPLMQWLDGKSSGYLAWSWDAYGACTAATAMTRGSPWSLVTDYTSGNPNGAYAQTFHDHLAGL
jgi:hypothetical protein